MSTVLPEYFELFGLPARFAIDPGRLEQAYRAVLARVHPDRFAAAGPAERRAAVQIASHANQAYEVLRSDSARAAYLCGRAGTPVDGEGAPALDARFLERQMELRERLEGLDADADAAQIAALAAEVGDERSGRLRRIAELLDECADAPAAAREVRALMFLDRLGQELQRRVAGTDSAATAGG